MGVRGGESHVLVQVAANEAHVREAVCTAVLSLQQFCVSGLGRLRDAVQAYRIGGANLIVAVSEHVEKTILEMDRPARADEVHAVLFVLDEKPAEASQPGGVVLHWVRDGAEAVRLVPSVLRRLLEQGRLSTSTHISATTTELEQLLRLSAREREILRLTGEGHSLNEIAGIVNRSVATVASHRSSIMIKTGLRNRVELTRLSIKTGLVRL